MSKKIALDWDEGELRLVAAQCNGSSIKVTDAAVISLDGRTVEQALRDEVGERGWSKAEALITIGRGKAELRELQLPAVPDEELPDMVRFQAIRSFASAGESATVDYLVTRRDEGSIELIAAAVGPAKLSQVREVCDSVGLTATRITLRPLCSAALYLSRGSGGDEDEVVLVDLLRDEAEIVIANSGSVVFVRTVRLPAEAAARGRSLAGELKRSLLASGSSTDSRRVILWGRDSVHVDDVQQLSVAAGVDVETLDPFSLVDVDRKTSKSLPEHTGRLAPLVGLLAADENSPDRLVDFLQPRKRPEPKSNRARTAALIGVPVAAVLLLGFLIYRQFAAMDQQIELLQTTVNDDLQPRVEVAEASIGEVAEVDKFLDGDVNWLAEMQRLATKMPPAETLLVREIRGTTSTNGGGSLTVYGSVTDSSVIEEFENNVRDDVHSVMGKGATFQAGQDLYQYTFSEEVVIPPTFVQAQRYAALEKLRDSPASAAPSGDEDKTNETKPETKPETMPGEDQDPPPAEVPSVDGDTEADGEQETGDLQTNRSGAPTSNTVAAEEARS